MSSAVTAILINLDTSVNNIPPLSVRPLVTADLLILLLELHSIHQY